MRHQDHLDALAAFFDEGLLTDVLFEVKSGKEATIWCCRGGSALHGDLVAAKVYRPLESRRFRNDAVYQQGRLHLARNSRVARAAQNKSRFGREVQYGTWLEQEWQTLNALFDAGADVPEPIRRGERALLMAFVGDDAGAAPLLNDVRLPRPAAGAVLDRLLWNVELMLDRHCVHGDLSPFNVLYGGERATIIDFPQAVDPRLNGAARELLARDVHSLCRWAARQGVVCHTDRMAAALWRRFVLGELG